MLLARDSVAHGHPLEGGFAASVRDLAVAGDRDVRGRLELTDQVLGHRLAQRSTTDEDGHVLCELREVYRGLSRRVATADDDDVLVLHFPGDGGRSAVVDACARVLVDRLDPEAAIRDARRDQTVRARSSVSPRCTR